MGTNYYLVPEDAPRCSKCGRVSECCGGSVHIGKSSHGWAFHFAAHEGLGTVDAWRRHLASADAYIEDEYDGVVSLADFWDMVAHKLGGKTGGDYTDAGCSFYRGYFS